MLQRRVLADERCSTTTRRRCSSTGDQSRSDCGTRRARKTMSELRVEARLAHTVRSVAQLHGMAWHPQRCTGDGPKQVTVLQSSADVQPSATPVVPANGRVPSVFFGHLSAVVREHQDGESHAARPCLPAAMQRETDFRRTQTCDTAGMDAVHRRNGPRNAG